MRCQKPLLPLMSVAALAGPAFAADVSSDSATSPWFESAGEAPSPWIVGHLDFGAGPRYPESDVFDTEPLWLANVFARANLVLFGGPLNFEAEVGGWVAFEDGDTLHTLEGIGHLWLRMPSAAAGVFGGWTTISGQASRPPASKARSISATSRSGHAGLLQLG